MKRILDWIDRARAWRNEAAKNAALGEHLYLISLAASVALYAFMINSSLPRMEGAGGLINLLKYVQLIPFAGLGIRLVVFCDYDRRSFGITLVMGALFAGNYLITNDMTMLRGFLLVAGARGIEFRRIAKWLLNTLIGCMLVIFALADAGLLLNYAFRRTAEEPLRYSLGFGHPNVLGMYTMIISMLWTYCYYDKLTWKSLIAVAMILLVLNLVANSRSSGAVIALMVVLVAAEKRWKARFTSNKVFRIFALMVLPAVFAASIYFSVTPFRANALTTLVNRAVTGRFNIINRYFQDYPMSFFGRTLITDVLNAPEVAIDNSVAVLILRFGVLQTAMAYGVLTAAVARALRHRDFPLLIMMLLFILYGFTASHTINAVVNFTLIGLTAKLTSKSPTPPAASAQ